MVAAGRGWNVRIGSYRLRDDRSRLIRYTAAKPLARDYRTLFISSRRHCAPAVHAYLLRMQVMTSLDPIHGTDEVRHLDGLRSRRPPSMAADFEPAPAREVSAGVVWGG